MFILMILVNAWQINPEKAREEFRDVSKKNGGTGVKDFMDGMGLGMIAEQVKQQISSLFLVFWWMLVA